MIIGTSVTNVNFEVPPEFVFTGTANSKVDKTAEMREIEVVTLKQYLLDQAADDAWKITSDFAEINKITNRLIKTKYHTAKEFVAIYDDIIMVGIDADCVDNSSFNHVFDLISKVKYVNGSVVKFGDDIKVYDENI